MGNGHCRILRQEKLRHRFADNVRAASHNGLKARKRIMNGLGKNHTAHRGARHERRQPTGKAARIDRMETVDILRWIDCRNDLLCVDLFGEGQLNQNTTDFLVGIEPGNESEQLGFAGRCRELAIESTHS